MDAKGLGFVLAKSADVSPARQLSIGGLVARCSRSVGDSAIQLLDALAYFADVLSAEQDRVASDGYLETHRDAERDVVRIRFPADLRPVVCLVIDQDRAYVATVGAEAGDSTVHFGDAAHGERPPIGFESVAATYREGAGRTGRLELRGLGLREPFSVIALTGSGGRSRCIRPCALPG
jgi:hypothetical protein